MNKAQKIALIIISVMVVIFLAVFFIFGYFDSAKKERVNNFEPETIDYCKLDFKKFQDSLGAPTGVVSSKRQIDKIRVNYSKNVKPIFAPSPGEAAHNFSQTLEEGDIEKALRQIYFDPVQKGKNWNKYRSWICEKNKEDLVRFASYIKSGELGEKTGEFRQEWIVKILVNQEEKEAPIGLIKVKDKGWQIDYL